MSTMKVDSIVSSGGTNTAQINGITPALASQAETEAGTDNTKLMTPLRVEQAIKALSFDYLGSLTTTSGTTQTLSGLVLTPYKFLIICLNGVSHNAGTDQRIQCNSVNISGLASNGLLIYGIIWGSLTGSASITPLSANNNNLPFTGIDNSTTSLAFNWSPAAAAFDAGSIDIYGVR